MWMFLLKIKWIIRLNFSKKQRWNIIGKQFLKSQDNAYSIEHFILECSNTDGLNLDYLPKFYKVCLKTWCEILTKQRPLNKEEIMQRVEENSEKCCTN